jgi:hypothetical protein
MTDDDAVIARLREVARTADPEPPELAGSARAAFGLYRFDEELAQLLHDSAEETVAVRGAVDDDEARLLSFGSEDVAADLEISSADAGACTVTGTVHGPVARAVLQTPEDTEALVLDEHGRFRVDGVTGAAVRVRMETESGVTVVTPWVRLG